QYVGVADLHDVDFVVLVRHGAGPAGGRLDDLDVDPVQAERATVPVVLVRHQHDFGVLHPLLYGVGTVRHEVGRGAPVVGLVLDAVHVQGQHRRVSQRQQEVGVWRGEGENQLGVAGGLDTDL